MRSFFLLLITLGYFLTGCITQNPGTSSRSKTPEVTGSTNASLSSSPTRQRKTLSGTLVVSLLYDSATFDNRQGYLDGFISVVEGFQSLYPRVNIITEIMSIDQFFESYQAMIKSGLGPDIFVLEDAALTYALALDLIEPIPKENLSVFDYTKKTIKAVSYNGQFYAIPWMSGTQVMCYNKAKVETIPSNLYQLVDFSRRGYSIGIHSNFEASFWGANVFGGKMFDKEGNAILNQGGWGNWLSFLKSLRDEPNVILSDNHFVLLQAFEEGRLAVITCYPYDAPRLATSIGSNNLGMALLPGLPNRPAAPWLYQLSFALNPVSSASRKEIAFELVKFLTSVEQQRQLALDWRTWIPTSRRAFIDTRLFPKLGVLQEQSQNAVTFTLEEQKRILQIYPAPFQLYDQVMAGTLTPASAAEQITNLLNQSPLEHRLNEH